MSRAAMSHMPRVLGVIVAGITVCLSLLVPLSHPTGAASPATQVRIGLFGDSLAVQAEPYFNLLVDATGAAKVTDFTYGGTAACDWLPDMRRFARSARPQAVLLEFIGNTFSPCMLGCAAGSQTSVRRYCSAVSTAIQVFLSVGTHVFLIGTPITRTQWLDHDPDWDALNQAFAALAAEHPDHVTFVDAGRAVEGPHHSFVSALRCMAFEPCTGPREGKVGTDIVRSPDGVHFCPVEVAFGAGLVSRCPVYSSGAFRFAAAMAAPLMREFPILQTRAWGGPARYGAPP